MRLSLLLCSLLMLGCAAGPESAAPIEPLRVASFNIAFSETGVPVPARLDAGCEDAARIAAILQRVRPDIVLLNEFDHAPETDAIARFVSFLREGQHGQAGIDYRDWFSAPVNSGVPSGLDLTGDGRADGPGDAWGFGHYPGQYGMLVLSRFPIDAGAVRTFQKLRWADMPGAQRPTWPDGRPFHSDEVWAQLRLSSKSHWDLPIATPAGRLHLLAAHPTPPAFDGEEQRNRRRNHDEIRLWADYLDPERSGWIVDDAGRRGGLDLEARFVLVGDYNADPLDGGSIPGAIQQLLEHPRVQGDIRPQSSGGAYWALADGGINLTHRGNPAEDTSRFSSRVGNLRVDYALPSTGLQVLGSGVFWPAPGELGADWVEASDHRLVWVDVLLP